jgi:hypothetical protein
MGLQYGDASQERVFQVPVDGRNVISGMLLLQGLYNCLAFGPLIYLCRLCGALLNWYTQAEQPGVILQRRPDQKSKYKFQGHQQ